MHWRPLAQVAGIAGLIFVLELVRGGLNYVYALSAGYLVHTRIVPELRGRVYDKLQRLSFRFFDNQKAVSVRSAFLQSKEYMDAFYTSGYTVLEMEAGPFLGAVYELVNPKRVPTDEIVHLSAHTSFDMGIIHYASDTPYSRRQSLLSKSLSFFGVDATYACAITIVRRILELECKRLAAGE